MMRAVMASSVCRIYILGVALYRVVSDVITFVCVSGERGYIVVVITEAI